MASKPNSKMTKKFKEKKDYKNYIGNKAEGQGFADKRKKKAAYEYLKLLKKEKEAAVREGREPVKHKQIPFLNKSSPQKGKGKKGHAFSAAAKIAKKKQEERQKNKEEKGKMQQEKDAAMKSYKERKQERHLKLCKKTSKGQPVMRYQMEVLLQKIKKQKGEGD